MNTQLLNNTYMFACYHQDYDLAKSLLSKGADVHYKSESILNDCVIHNDLDFIQFLFSQGVTASTPRHRAVQASSSSSRLNILKFFGENGADLKTNIEIIGCQTRLGNVPIVQYLHSKGVDIHFMDDHLFRYACIRNHLPLAQYLLNNGANIHALNGDALLGLLQSEERNLPMIQFLLDNYENKELAFSILEKHGKEISVDWAKSYLEYSKLHQNLEKNTYISSQYKI